MIACGGSRRGSFGFNSKASFLEIRLKLCLAFLIHLFPFVWRIVAFCVCCSWETYNTWGEFCFISFCMRESDGGQWWSKSRRRFFIVDAATSFSSLADVISITVFDGVDEEKAAAGGDGAGVGGSFVSETFRSLRKFVQVRVLVSCIFLVALIFFLYLCFFCSWSFFTG